MQRNILTRHFLVRNIEAEELLENFLVSAMAAVLVIRFYLHLAGYPSIGIAGLHLAHVLWGGVLMVTAIVILLSFLNRGAMRAAAIISGIGFGMFIDEIGKFITGDNNYFFQPALAIMYVSFILIYFITLAITRKSVYSQEEYLVNALEMAKEAAVNDLNDHEKRQAMEWLRAADGSSLARMLRRFFANRASSMHKPGMLAKAKQAFKESYHRLVRKTWFSHAVITFFVLHSVFTLYQTAILFAVTKKIIVAGSLGAAAMFLILRAYRKTWRLAQKAAASIAITIVLWALWEALGGTSIPALSVMEWGELLSSTTSAALVLAGITRLRHSRLAAYRWFKRAVLVSILLTQFFAFYKNQFLALAGLALNIMILATLHYMMSQEEGKGQ